MTKKIRVLVIDDSALVRSILAEGLSADPNLEVVGTAQDPFAAREEIVKLRPDVLTLDVEMPRMNGVEFLRRLMPQYPLPVVMVSSLTQRGKEITLQALEAGAVDFVAKPTSDIAQGLQAMMVELRAKITIASTANVSHWKSKRDELFAAVRTKADVRGIAASIAQQGCVAPNARARVAEHLNNAMDKVIAIGASTGGTEALRKVLVNLPLVMPGIVVTQHLPSGFTKMFAERLNQECIMRVKEAENGDKVMRGRILIAPGDKHINLVRSGRGQYNVVLTQEDRVNGHRPSVDVMMLSVAQIAGANALGVILTGMGSDGAAGLKAMREAGAETFAQDEATSVVYGMPKVASDIGAAKTVLPLGAIAAALADALGV